jgi:hypothetical protein
MNKEELKKNIEGIDENTEVIVLKDASEVSEEIRTKSIVRRIGDSICYIKKKGIAILTVWILLSSSFPDYVPIPQVMVARSAEIVSMMLKELRFGEDGIEIKDFDKTSYPAYIAFDHNSNETPAFSIPGNNFVGGVDYIPLSSFSPSITGGNIIESDNYYS